MTASNQAAAVLDPRFLKITRISICNLNVGPLVKCSFPEMPGKRLQGPSSAVGVWIIECCLSYTFCCTLFASWLKEEGRQIKLFSNIYISPLKNQVKNSMIV